MNHTIRRALSVFPLGLLLAGCNAAHRSEYRQAPPQTPVRAVAMHPASPTERSVPPSEVHIAPRPSNQPDRAVATASRYAITLDEIRGYVRNNTAVIIDAREPAAFAEGHVRGALNMPAHQKEAYMEKINKDVSTSQLIIIYCGGPQCFASDTVYEYATSQGFSNMRIFKPGWQTLALSRDLH